MDTTDAQMIVIRRRMCDRINELKDELERTRAVRDSIHHLSQFEEWNDDQEDLWQRILDYADGKSHSVEELTHSTEGS